MAGKGHEPPPAVRPCQPAPPLPGERRGVRSAAGHTATASVLPPPPINPSSAQHVPPPATILYKMFSTCVARGIAAKLVLKSVGGQVVTSLYCSSSSTTTSAARANQKQGRKRPDNERRRMRREAWLQRRHSSKPGPAARTAAVASAVPVSEGEAAAAVSASEGEAAAAAAVLAPQGAAAAATSLQGLAQSLVQVDCLQLLEQPLQLQHQQQQHHLVPGCGSREIGWLQWQGR